MIKDPFDQYEDYEEYDYSDITYTVKREIKKSEDHSKWILTEALRDDLLEKYFTEFFNDGSLDIDDVAWKIQVEEYRTNFQDDKYGRPLGALNDYDLFWYVNNLDYKFSFLKQMCKLEIISREYRLLEHKRIIDEQTRIACSK